MTVYWHAQGNSQEQNAGGSDYAHGYVGLYLASAPVPVTQVSGLLHGSTYWPDFRDQKVTVIAGFVPGSINIVTMRPGTMPPDPFFVNTYGAGQGGIDAWAAEVLAVFQDYLAAGFKIVPVSSLLGSTPSRRYIMDGILRSWVGRYTNGFCDMSADPIMSDDAGLYAAHPTEFQSDGHLKDPGSALVYSYFKPAMDGAVRPSFFARL